MEPPPANFKGPESASEIGGDRLRARTALTLLTFLSAGALLLGVSYVVAQWLRIGRIADGLFVSLLVVATFSLSASVRRAIGQLQAEGVGALLYLRQTSEQSTAREVEIFLRELLDLNRAIAVGATYGLVVGAAVPVLGVWGEEPVLAVLLAAFLFIVNVATGVGLLGLLQFFLAAIRLGRTMRIDLWQVDNPATTFVVGATRRVAIMTALYAAVCNSSVLFSLLPINGYIIGYFVFSGLVLVSSIAVPVLPIVKRLEAAKRKVLADFDRRLFVTFSHSLGDLTGESIEVDFESLKTLLDLREQIRRQETWPFRLQAVFAALSVMLLSAIPVVLQVVIDQMIE